MAKGTTIRMWRRALLVLTALIVVGFGVIVFRLIQLQLVQGETLQQMAVDQQLKDTKISAQRGTIYDCNMKPLAQSATVWKVVLEPSYFSKDENLKKKIVSGLSEILKLDEKELMDKASKRSFYIVIKRKVESDIKDKIIAFQKENNIKAGIRLIEDYKRYYPYGDFASAVIGFTGTDSQGLSGIENYYNDDLTGQAGRIVTARNAVGTDMPFEYEKMVSAKNGNNLVLYMNEVIQHFLEKGLEEGIANNKVMNRAVAIMMDVNTGGILGMAVKGGYDLNKPFEIVDEQIRQKIESLPDEERPKARAEACEMQWRNKAVSDTYMPGSVWKMITTSMAFEENLIDENTNFNCSGSFVPFNGARPIRCHKHGGHGSQTFERAFCNSCNPAFIQIGQLIGPERFYKYYSSFGFTEKTGIDLPGEANGIFFSKDGSMGPMDLAVASFGQNFSITPIQMITAAAAVVNGGYLVRPRIVKQIIDNDGNIIKSFDVEKRRQVISEETSRRVCALLRQNAIDGGAKNGDVAGFRVFGKTGTTQKIGMCSGDGMDYISSFCGGAPADNPQFVLLIYYDTPKGDSYYGAMVAAPTFAKIMQDALPYLGVEKIYNEEELKNLDVTVPFLVGSSVAQAKNQLNNLQLNPVVYGDGERVVSQIPEVSTSMQKGGTIVLYTDSNFIDKKAIVPKLTGLSLSAANKAATNAGINISIKGTALSGNNVISVSQSEPEGKAVSQGTVVTVEFNQVSKESRD